MLGTVGYMSPEQVRGQEADARSDIFSFGAVLYEMLTGKRAFRGETAAETMTAILRADPPEPASVHEGIPLGLERIVDHCLEKDPSRRFRTAHDLAFALETASGASSRSAAGVAVAAAARGLAGGGWPGALPGSWPSASPCRRAGSWSAAGR